jgi:hypothetical protein
VVTLHHVASNMAWLDLPPGDAGTGLVGEALGVVLGGHPFVFDPFAAYHAGLTTNPNMMVTGTLGAGKSAFVKMLILRSLAEGRRVVVVDPKGEYQPLAAAVAGATSTPWAPWRLPRLEQFDLVVALATTLRDGPLHDREWTALYAAWRTVCEERSSAAMHDVVAALRDVHCDALADQLTRTIDGDVAALFATEPERADVAPLTVWDLSQWWTGPRVGVAVLLALAAAEELLVHDARPGLLVLDEAWAVLANPWAVSYLAGSWKLARARGIAHVAVVHRAGDLVAAGDQGTAHAARAAGLLADCETTVSFRCAPGDRTSLAEALALSSREQATVAALPRGTALFRYGSARSVVTFTPTDDEWPLLGTDGAMR